jgi:hypothetical protein
MIKRLRGSGFRDPLLGGRVRRAGCSLCSHAVCGGFFPPKKEGKKETATVESGWARTSLNPRHRRFAVTLTQYTRAKTKWQKEKISILQTLFVRRNVPPSIADMNTGYRKSSAKERDQKGACFTSGQATLGDLVICSRTRQRGKRHETLRSLRKIHGVCQTKSGAVLLSSCRPSDLEDEIDKLSSAASPSDADQKKLKDLKAELENIVKKKEKYVEEHPEQRKLVFRSRRQPKDGQSSKGVVPASETAEEEGGPFIVLADPTVINCVHTEDTDDDIPMPDCPPPGVSKEEEEEDTDDDIPMPEGPPPGSARTLCI